MRKFTGYPEDVAIANLIAETNMTILVLFKFEY